MTPMPLTPDPWAVAPTGAAAALTARFAAAVPELETARLRLRAPRLGDFEAYAAIATSERGRGIGGPMTREDAWADFSQMVAGWLLRGHGLWSVERREDCALLGFLPLHHEFGDPEPEIGFVFVAEAEGRGFAFEAAEAARGFAFDHLGWTSVVSYIDGENARSSRLARRLGARLDAAPHPLDDTVQVWRHLAVPGPETRA
jgi:RimJ/RimL family protein N-acetyltransferase